MQFPQGAISHGMCVSFDTSCKGIVLTLCMYTMCVFLILHIPSLSLSLSLSLSPLPSLLLIHSLRAVASYWPVQYSWVATRRSAIQLMVTCSVTSAIWTTQRAMSGPLFSSSTQHTPPRNVHCVLWFMYMCIQL